MGRKLLVVSKRDNLKNPIIEGVTTLCVCSFNCGCVSTEPDQSQRFAGQMSEPCVRLHKQDANSVYVQPSFFVRRTEDYFSNDSP